MFLSGLILQKQTMHEGLEQVDRIIICSDGCYKHKDLNAMINHSGAFEFDGIFEDDASLWQMKKVNADTR